MPFSIAPRLSPPDVENVLSLTADFELSRNFRSIIHVLQSVWKDIDSDPDFSKYPEISQAKLYRAVGYFLVFYGRSQVSPDYMRRGSRILLKAARLFKSLDETDLSYEAQIIYGVSFGLRGDFVKCEKILKKCEDFYAEDKSHHNFLLIQVNQLFVLHQTRNFTGAKSIVEKYRAPIESFGDDKLKYQFFNQAGIVYRNLDLFELSEAFFKNGISSAGKLSSPVFLAIIKNNLSMLLKDEKRYAEAADIIEQALKIVKDLDDYDLLGHFSDTKAQIYFEMKNYEIALLTVNKSIFYFRSGDDYLGRTAALWLKTKILFKMGRRDEAKFQYDDLMKLATDKCGANIVKYYAKEFDAFMMPAANDSPPETEIFKITSENLLAEDANAAHFLIPPIIAKIVFAVDEKVVVMAVRDGLSEGEFAVFLLNGKFTCGQVIKNNGWYLKEVLTLKDVPVEHAKFIRKIREYKDISNIIEEPSLVSQ